MDILLRSNFDCELVQSVGSDEMICKAARVSTLGAASLDTSESAGLINFLKAARVSTLGAASLDTSESAGLINFLMRNRHGTPFEHAAMTFRISAPIFVWREYMRHRIGFSYNEESGRYKELAGVFYMPPRDRELIQRGKAGEYIFSPGTDEQYSVVYEGLKESYEKAWNAYQVQLSCGIAKEVARMCLPVAIYSTAYVTLNPRSMMAFLSLRTKDERSMFPSTPMKEINKVATMMEETFEFLFPITYEAFNKAQRVGP